MGWLSQLGLDLTQDAFGELKLSWPFLRVVNQLESYGANCPLKPRAYLEVLALARE